MFQNAFQSGTHLEIFHPKIDKDKEKKLFKITNPSSLSKIFDRTTRGYIYELEKGLKPSLSFPASDKQDLGIIQPFLVFQAYFPVGEHFSIEITVTNTAKSKRRFHFTTGAKGLELTYFHARIPLEIVKRDTWINLSFDMISFFELFKGQTFRSIDAFSIGGVCKIRRIFTMKQPLIDSEGEIIKMTNEEMIIPKTQNFGPGVPHTNQLLTLDLIKSQILDNNHSVIGQEQSSLEIFGTGMAFQEKGNISSRDKLFMANHRRVRSTAKDVVNASVELSSQKEKKNCWVNRNSKQVIVNNFVDKENIKENVPVLSAWKTKIRKPVIAVRHSVQNIIRCPSITDDLIDLNDDEMEWKEIPKPEKEEKIKFEEIFKENPNHLPLKQVNPNIPSFPIQKEEEKKIENDEKSQQRNLRYIPKNAVFERFLNKKAADAASNQSILSGQEMSVEMIYEIERPSYDRKEPPRINKWFQNSEDRAAEKAKKEETPVKIEERKINTAEKKEKENEDSASKNGFLSERGSYMTSNKGLEIKTGSCEKERLPSIWDNVLGIFQSPKQNIQIALPTEEPEFNLSVMKKEEVDMINNNDDDDSGEAINWVSDQAEEVQAQEIVTIQSESEDSNQALEVKDDSSCERENETHDISEIVPLQAVEKSTYFNEVQGEEPETTEQSNVLDEDNLPYDTEKEEGENLPYHSDKEEESDNISSSNTDELSKMNIREDAPKLEGEDSDNSDELESRGSEIEEPSVFIQEPSVLTEDQKSQEKPRFSHESTKTVWYSVKSDFGSWNSQRKTLQQLTESFNKTLEQGKEQYNLADNGEESSDFVKEDDEEELKDKSSALEDSLELMINKYAGTSNEKPIEEKNDLANIFKLDQGDFRSPPVMASLVDEDGFSYQGLGSSESEDDDEIDDDFGKFLDESDFGIMKTLKTDKETGGLEEGISGGEMEVVYDPVWKCYYHPKTNSYFEFK